ncbi:MAG: hypothetical protein P8R54_11030 [Myxococcota bacterium]|nr:hypothetical protein [Myxococcota bacterium]
MPAKSFSPAPQSSTPSSTTTVSTPTPEVSNSERLQRLQQGNNSKGLSSSGSLMYGEMDWLQDWLEEGPQTLEQIETGQLDSIPDAVVTESADWNDGAIQGTVSGRAKLSDNPTATGTGSLSAAGENSQAAVSGTVLAAPGTLAASGSAEGSVEQDGNRMDISASGSTSNTGQKYGELDAALSHKGQTGDLQHTARTAGSITSAGTASLDGSVGGSIEKGGGTVAVSADGSINNKGQRDGKLVGQLSHEGSTGDLNHSVRTTGSVDADGTAAIDGIVGGSIEKGGGTVAVSADGKINNKGLRDGKLVGQFSHEGSTGDLDHSMRTTGSVDADGTAAIDGTVSGRIEKGGGAVAVSADGKINNKGLKDGKLVGQVTHSGSTGDLDHTVRTTGSVDSAGTASLDGSVGGSIEKGGGTLSVSADGKINNKGLRSGKLVGQFNHSGSTGDLDHTVQTMGSIDSTGQKNIGVKGRVGSSDTVQDGDATVTTSAYLGAGADLNKGLSGEVGMMRKTATDGALNTQSATASADKNGPKLSLTNKNIRERSRDSTELTFQGKTDGSSTIKLGGKMSGEAWQKSGMIVPGVSATARALGGGLGADMSFNREADGSASLGANAKASLLLGEGVMYTERELVDLGDFGIDGDARVRAAAEASADAKASLKLDKGMAVEAAVKAFVGARAEASTGATITWKREEDYGPMLEDFANNLPGTWDDALLDRLPDAWWTDVGTALFGKGKTDLLRVGVGVDARAGAGAEASLSGGVSEQGLVETEISAGAAVGVGGGARLQVGFNPIDILRRGLADSIEVVNDSFSYAEVMWQYATKALGGTESFKVETIDAAAADAKTLK